MKRSSAALLSLLLFLIPASGAVPPAHSAASAVLMDADSGRVLLADRADEPRPIASITKLMTALCVCEAASPDRTLTIRPEWTGIEGSSMYLRAGEELTVRDLLSGLLLVSGNDAAVALASGCAGSEAAFCTWMNDRAALLGMTRTHFTSPNGLDDEGNRSTARDMALLAQAVLQEKELVALTSARTVRAGGRTLVNHNRLLWQYEGCLGLKTGYTQRAGRTLVSCARREGQTLIAVTLSDREDWRDHRALLDYGFKTYPRRTLAEEGSPFGSVLVRGALERRVPVELERDLCWPLAEGERWDMTTDLPLRAEAPVKRGQRAGTLTLLVEGVPVGARDLIYSRDGADLRPGRT